MDYNEFMEILEKENFHLLRIQGYIPIVHSFLEQFFLYFLHTILLK